MRRTSAFVVATISGNSILNLSGEVSQFSMKETRGVDYMHQLRSRKKLFALFL